MKRSLFLAGILAIAGLLACSRGTPGYGGAIGFKNQSTSNLDYIQIVGFSSPIEARSLAPSEHSFNYVGSQVVPPTVTVSWRLVGSPDTQTATVSLASVPTTLADGEIFFVFRDPANWTVEYADRLQLDSLQKGK